jgi:glycosyltransferase involved in cell wall biosynthesis
MSPAAAPPTFSVIIPTRNRSGLFERTVQSVFEQDIDDYEVIVVDDGSTGPDVTRYRALALEWAGRRVHFHALVHRPKGHGPAYSRNFGASRAAGRFLCFLDDDDLWIDAAHLRRCRDTLAAEGDAVDLYFTDQRAVYADGSPHTGRLWISGMEQRCAAPADARGNHRVSVDELMQVSGFAHLNCSVYRRGFYDAIGGMDETLRYENDRDVYLRAVDAAHHMLYNPTVVALHHIPDAQRKDNVSTAVSQLEKRLFQLRIFDKALLAARQPAVRAFARRSKAYTLQHIALGLQTAGRPAEAAFYMREALLVGFSPGWLLQTVRGTLRAAFSRPNA